MAKKTKTEAKKKANTKSKTTSTVARSGDGTIQITFTIPYQEVDTKKQRVLKEIGETIEIPGFRKGKAPLTKVAEHTSSDTVIQRTLSQILPELVGEVIKKENIRPAIYPKFELVKAMDGEPWQVRAVSCELPKVKLGDYKKELKGKTKASSIWTPEKGDPTKKEEESKNEPTRAQKEQEAIQTLVKSINIKIPKLLIDEETNSKLSQLLGRIEKLGLNLDSYLASIGKNAQTLRTEYEIQAKASIQLDLILTQIALDEKLKVDEKEVETALKASSADPNMAKKSDNEQQRRVIESILIKRKALDFVVSLM